MIPIKTIFCIVALFVCALLFTANASPPGDQTSVDVATHDVVMAAVSVDQPDIAQHAISNAVNAIGYAERTTFSPAVAFAEPVLRIPDAPTIAFFKPPVGSETRPDPSPEQVLLL